MSWEGTGMEIGCLPSEAHSPMGEAGLRGQAQSRLVSGHDGGESGSVS